MKPPVAIAAAADSAPASCSLGSASLRARPALRPPRLDSPPIKEQTKHQHP